MTAVAAAFGADQAGAASSPTVRGRAARRRGHRHRRSGPRRPLLKEPAAARPSDNPDSQLVAA
jgi:hypothetical protein